MKFKQNSTHVPHFTMLLGEMSMVKTGVIDRQQAPPSYPFVVLSKDTGLALDKLLDKELRTM